jgi:hypothetical protein
VAVRPINLRQHTTLRHRLVDLLSIVCVIAIHAESVTQGARRAALQTLMVAVLESGAANWTAGGSIVAKAASVFTVLAILLSEWVAAKVRTTPTPFRAVSGRPASLSPARSSLDDAMRQLILWHGRGLRYVTAGHKTMELIDTTLRELHTAGGALATEIREDQIDRAERVDALLARIEGRL